MFRTISPISLGYSILAGPILWAIHFIVVYLFAEFGCRANFNNLVYFSPDSIRIVVLIATLIALIGVGVGEVIAYRSWMTAQSGSEESPQRMQFQFLTMMGILLSALFMLGIFTTAVPTFFIDVCSRVL
jgi:hypothetical protein